MHSISSLDGVIFFFCQFDNAASLRARTILGSLIRQILTGQKLNAQKMPESFEKRLIDLFQNEPPDSEHLENFFVDELATSKIRFVVIDGIDECMKNERNILFAVFRKIALHSSHSIKIFIASRPQIGHEIKRSFKLRHQRSMSSPEVDADIATYIKSVLEEKRNNEELNIGRLDITEIEDALVSGALGMLVVHELNSNVIPLTATGIFWFIFRSVTSAIG